MPVGRYGDFALYSRLLREARPYWPQISLLGLLDLLHVPLALLLPLSLKIAVDSVLGSQPLPGFLEDLLPTATRSVQATLALAVGLAVGVPLVDNLRSFAGWVLSIHTSERIALQFRAKLFRHLQRLSLTYHDTAGTADSIYRVERDAESIKVIALGFMPYAVAIVTLVGMLYVTIRIDWQLSIVALIGSPLAMIVIATQRRRVRERWNEIFEHQSRALAVVQEVLSAVRLVKSFGREDREQERFIHHSHRSVLTQVRAAVLEGGLESLVAATFALTSAAALLLGVLHIQQGQLTLGDLLLVMAYISQLYGPLELLSRFSADLQSSFAAAARVCTVLDREPEIVDRPNARALVRSSGAVAFRDVSFRYDAGEPVIRDMSFEVPPGSRVGISGPTGSGKTTLVSLMARFYDPTSGQIMLDGVDLRDYRLADLNNQIAIVLQEPVLFSSSIAENIAYARPEATIDEIVASAAAANADAFISSLAEGYDTLVGERGMRLSGGERQRISLARAFLKDAPILILDEPTSSVDVATEAQIMESMQRLMKGRTTFMIAHRLSTLEICDLRLEIDHGRLVSFGRIPAVSAKMEAR
jgi:ATP-binding cassette subfamily B protein